MESYLPTSDLPPGSTVPRSAAAGGCLPGDRVGRYAVRQVLGEGGMGTVFRAEQVEPVRREVALKLVKAGMDSRAVVARFEAERQALAVMDHPCIAKVLDGGVTDPDQGARPYFVMELVRGEPITAHCDKHRLGISERVELFVRVCEAVQHAHTKGVVHRDLKPSNILVSYQDGRSVPKVIDFGVAKALHHRLSEQTLFTERGQMVGTPEYMSPEQAEMSGQDVDTRSDVYSLGVVLYELLTGHRPFESETLRRASLFEVQRLIREVDPPRPSTRLASSPDPETSARIAELRRTEARALGVVLRRDLDWVVMKCLEKDRARRYETASALAAELERYLRDEPVLAGPPGVGYRVGKFFKRHRAGVVFAGLGLGALVASAGVSMGFAVSAARARTDADARSEELETIADFQADQLRGLDALAMGASLREDLAARYEARLRHDGVDPPELERASGELRAALERIDFTTAALGAIEAHVFAPARRAIEEQLEGQPALQARLLNTLAGAMGDTGLLEPAEAAQVRALELFRASRGAEHEDTIGAMYGVAYFAGLRGDFAQAEALTREALDLSRRALGDDHEDTLSALNNLGYILSAQGRLEDAERHYRAAFEGRSRVLGSEHESTILSMSNLAVSLDQLGRYDEAEELYSRSLELSRKVLGDEDPGTIVCMNNLAYILGVRGRDEEAAALFREALALRRRVLGDEHADTLSSIGNLASHLVDMGELDYAERLCAEGLETTRRVLGEDHLDVGYLLNTMGAIRAERDDLVGAGEYYQQAWELRRRLLGEEHPSTLVAMSNVATNLEERDRFEEAERLLRTALEIRERTVGPEHPDTLLAMNNLGLLLKRSGRGADAEVLYRRALEPLGRVMGKDHPWTTSTMANLSRLLMEQGEYAEAEGLALEAARLTEARWGPTHEDTLDAFELLAELYDAWHAVDPSAGHDARAAASRAKLPSLASPGR